MFYTRCGSLTTHGPISTLPHDVNSILPTIPCTHSFPQPVIFSNRPVWQLLFREASGASPALVLSRLLDFSWDPVPATSYVYRESFPELTCACFESVCLSNGLSLQRLLLPFSTHILPSQLGCEAFQLGPFTLIPLRLPLCASCYSVYLLFAFCLVWLILGYGQLNRSYFSINGTHCLH